MSFMDRPLGQAIACAVYFDDQQCGIYAGDADCYEDFREVFEPIILEYHGLKPGFSHISDMDATCKIVGNIDNQLRPFFHSPGGILSAHWHG